MAAGGTQSAAGVAAGGTQSAAGVAAGGTQTPITGNATTDKAMKDAEKAVEEANKLTPEELSTQEELDRLQESTKQAYRNARGETIPMEFITGKLKALEERALGLAEPLEKKLSRLQAKRVAGLESSKFALKRLDKAKEKATPKAPEPFTLRPGEIRYDASGKVLATGGAKPPSEAAQLKAAEAAQAKATGKSAALDNYSLVNELLSNPNVTDISGYIS